MVGRIPPTVRSLVRIADEQLLPPGWLFIHNSHLHGRNHTARVLIHAFRLVRATGLHAEMPRLWAAVFLHDIARTHDGRCVDHGHDAWPRYEAVPYLARLFTQAGVRKKDLPDIRMAVKRHCGWKEDRSSNLLMLLKDADALDRVRIGDLDVSRLRFPEARTMVSFAERLLHERVDF